MVSQIHPSKALYIKLGKGGDWETECLEQKQTLRMFFAEGEAPHSLCVERQWNTIFLESAWSTANKRTITGWVNQTKLFYECGPDVLWVTFYKNRLWWCFSEPDVAVRDAPSGSFRERPVVGRWRDCSLSGVLLDESRLSGKLVKTKGFRGTICRLDEPAFKYLVDQINGRRPSEVIEAELARSKLASTVEVIITHLHWRDFELLVDLIFSQAGWKRISELGGKQKTLDLVLEQPITRQQCAVQVKSEAGRNEFEEYEGKLLGMPEYDPAYFIVHTPSTDLNTRCPTGKVQLLRAREIAEWSVRYGLVDWVIDKAG